MKSNKDKPFQTREQAVANVTKWLEEHSHEYPKGLTPHVYSIFPFAPDGCKTIALECNRTHKIVRRFYFKESEAKQCNLKTK